ncbi:MULTISPECIES: BglG family transcription antiterminator LicT [Bacillota]|jgi:beta-glucoside operon transcriptional antiterminator|uniref:PRD domain-containing protein n=2 Tax=Amedibacillus TaxID=2749846 RepID=A0A7G9GK01_9FIRM|nr:MULTISPECIES: PRD domain-containing protein [Bacillota]QNM11133.1 PRD domain-containing protein [[Eubacterium] hominis]MCH4284816.1 PRD domain-containing protein [Amedibacillus hominis]RGB52646.1 PRD domain-containing protein [Absiella sp. AM22-9]RGB57119.1 PRD domain-containing protein [Absiella sp. AM10-20]RGB68030.1 PRD domain-containing protein [Absiella sp. AM09-45]
MVIDKVLNTNVVLAKNDEGEQVIVMGCGVAFGKKAGEMIDDTKIDKIFSQDVPKLTDHFKKLVKDIPEDYINLAEEIIKQAKLKLGKEFNDDLYFSLSDHIYFTIQRYREGMLIQNRLLIETKRLYKEEFKVAMQSLQMINQRYEVELPEDEAAFIALHFVNAELNGDMQGTMQMTKVVQDILTIIKNFKHIDFDEDSLTYYRLVTHLKFFAQRILQRDRNTGNSENQLFQVVKEKYKESFTCVERIAQYVDITYGYPISDDDKLYLTIHIERVSNN